ncbi:DUF917 domain-containing protein [Candidatus Regiella endosymbiont of Tuberolachnus salignus]|uniref:DUF917 domain-containing protein n=1 Tax=Candidatus Regiella endosymbiont of Tuberolachnus salignus TaxID=3077956 RepID=UPI0030D527EE
MRLLDKTQIHHIAAGASVLASGGGGDPHIGKIMALNAIEQHGRAIKLLNLEMDMDELDPDALIVATGMIGAPSVMIEKLPNGSESIEACRFIERYLGKKIDAIYPIEIGGVNSLLPLATAAHLGVPLIDVDAMGRAFPEFHMTTFYLDGINSFPFVLVDSKANIGLVQAKDSYETEKQSRALCVAMGGLAFFAAYPITPAVAKASGILGTISRAQEIGETLEKARNEKADIVQVLTKLLKGFVLFRGRANKIDLRVTGGFTCGLACFDGVDTDKGKTFNVSFQNEYLLAQCDDLLLCSTPDLIILLDEDTGVPILAERLRYGSRVVALGVPADKKLCTPQGLEVTGPQYFNYDVNFTPVEELVAANRRE